MITIATVQLQKIFPKASEQLITEHHASLVASMEKYGINTQLRIANFLAQIGHECADLTHLSENLNYSAERILEVFKKHVHTLEFAAQFAHKPEKLANYVYANRNGNGGEISGDGYRFKGRGMIMTTGRRGYQLLSLELKYDFLSDPEALQKAPYAALSAAYYWKLNNLNQFADSRNIRALTVAINGGLNGFDDRKERTERIIKILDSNSTQART